jgi:cyclase
VAVNSLLLKDPSVVKNAVEVFGAQAVIGVVDVRQKQNKTYDPFNFMGFGITKSLTDYCLYLQNDIGVGELLLQNATREGTWAGYDHEMIREVLKIVDIPVIVMGGASGTEDLKKVLYETGAGAAAIGSMAVYQKKGMGVLIRFPKRQLVVHED